MFVRLNALLIAAALSCAAMLPASPVAAQEIPVETLFKRSEFRTVTLSPNGKLLAAIAPFKGRNNLAVIDLEKKQLMRVTAFQDSDVNNYFWANNERLVFVTGDEQGFEFRGNGGVFAVNIDGSQDRELNPTLRSGRTGIRGYQPLQRVRGSEDEIFVSARARSQDSNDVYRVNTRTGKRTLITFDTPGNVSLWTFDANQVPRAALVTTDENLKSAFYYRADEKSPWQKMYEWGPDGDEIIPRGFAGNGTLYVSSNVGRETKAVYEYDPVAKKLGKLVLGDDRYDIFPGDIQGGAGTGRLFFGGGGEGDLAGVSYIADKPKTIWFDEERAKRQSQIDRALPNTINTIGAPINGKMLVTSSSDRDPGTVYIYDANGPSLTEALRIAEWIKPQQMNEMRPISFTARDGMRIDGYLTLPKSWKAGAPAPMIMHPHGGPWARDVWGYNPEVQFMANRGYAVLQVNFRNSIGHGKTLFRSGWRQWGDKAQDDILDGVMWAIKEGYADKNKIGIYGASYGGYSVLMQLVRSPELYKFGFNYVGVTDMIVHRDTQPAWFGGARKYLDILNGNPSENREMLERTSPARFVSRIKAPVMHAYGGADRNVNPENGKVIKAAFENAGLPVDYTFIAEEGHGYREDANRFMLYKKFDEFMKTNMPVK